MTTDHHANDLRESIEAVREPAEVPASGDAALNVALALADGFWKRGLYEGYQPPPNQPASGVEARVCEDGWRPIESAPEKPGWYLGSFDGALRCVGYDSVGWGFWGTPSDQRIEELTHWQPLPPPPAERSDHE